MAKKDPIIHLWCEIICVALAKNSTKIKKLKQKADKKLKLKINSCHEEFVLCCSVRSCAHLILCSSFIIIFSFASHFLWPICFVFRFSCWIFFTVSAFILSLLKFSSNFVWDSVTQSLSCSYSIFQLSQLQAIKHQIFIFKYLFTI